MKVDIQIKIKTKSGKEVVLDGKDAKELYEQLSEIYDKEKEYVPYYIPRPYYPYYTTPVWTTTTWKSTSGSVCITSGT